MDVIKTVVPSAKDLNKTINTPNGNITTQLQNEDLNYSLIMSLVLYIKEYNDIFKYISNSSHKTYSINNGYLYINAESENKHVIKAKSFSNIKSLNQYLESLNYHYFLRNNSNKILNNHTLSIFRTFLFKCHSNYWVTTEFEYAEKTLADMIGKQSYQENERKQHFLEIMNYLNEMHNLSNKRRFFSDVKPENCFLITSKSDTNQTYILKFGDMENSLGTIDYILPSEIVLDETTSEITVKKRTEYNQLIDVFAFKMLGLEILFNNRYFPFRIQVEDRIKKKYSIDYRKRNSLILDYLRGEREGKSPMPYDRTPDEVIKELLSRRQEEMKNG